MHPQRILDGTLKVAIIEDQDQIRNGLRILIDGTSGYRCIAACRTVEEALWQFAREAPDVALVDIGLPGVSGIEGTRKFKERYPAIQVMILTVYDDDERIFQALCAGAFGYLLKSTPPARLIECIHEVANGGAPVSPEIARRVIALFQKIRPAESADYELTPHESRILKLLVDGHNYKTAAAELNVSINTISFHVRRIYEKLQVHSKSEAVAKALRGHLIG
ncbi:MAG TPA: response regulator transcription factor [Bryobacteraceae bacterium]|jgi:DNA-binding NarL/FixJ family response regulator